MRKQGIESTLTDGGSAIFTRAINRASHAAWHVGVIAVLLGLFAGARGLQAQSVPQAVGDCWDCVSMWYPEPLDCFIDSCTWAAGTGWSNCIQSGGCGDLDTCKPEGHGCDAGFAILLDGRSAVGLSSTQVNAVLAEAGPEYRARLAWFNEGDTKYLKLSCNGTLIFAVYSPAETARLRLRTHRLTL